MEGPADAGSERAVPRRRRRLLLAVVALFALAVVVFGIAAGAAVHLSTNLTRLDGVFDGLAHRPPVAAGASGATNVLVVATDRGQGAREPGTDPGDVAQDAASSDTLMLLHLDADRLAASVISIPRDTVVEVPGHGRQPVSAAFALGGPRLGVETVEQLTGVRVDHVAVIDWSRFGALVDAVGGIDVDVAETVRDPETGTTWDAGRLHLSGEQAVAFVRQREGLPRGDLDRVARQHAVLRSLMADAFEQEMRKDPLLLYRVLDTLTEHLAVDGGWSDLEMAGLGVSMRDFRSAGISYLTMPVEGAAPTASGRYEPDAAAAAALWRAVAQDRVGEWLADHPEALTPQAVL